MIDDIALRRQLLDELEWDPAVDATHVGVTAAHGAVTLSGHVSSYAELFAARRAARRVAGVKAVADDVEVRLPSGHQRDDSDIAETIVHVLTSNVSLPDSDLRAEVRDGNVTLHGTVDWQAQRRHVERQVAHVSGVRSIANQIGLRARARPEDVQERIERALGRHAAIEERHVTVRVVDATAFLEGSVGSLRERELIEMAAWSAPGVLEVVDEIEIG